MRLYESDLYCEDIEYVAGLELPWDKLKGKSIMITGATGQVGSMLIDVLMYKNKNDDLNCCVYALGRSEDRMKSRFDYCYEDSLFNYVKYDASDEISMNESVKIDYVLHLASNTHPMQYSTDPIGTITTNIIGLKNILDFSVDRNAKRVLFTSSNEVYGQNRNDVEFFDEKYCGYIDCNTMRAGYPESKRCGEALCQAYIAQKNLDVVIARITRTYGPTLLNSDTKALSQFLYKALANEDIVLKSEGKQYFSYLYIADTVSGLLTVLLNGETGEAYNVSDKGSDVMLKDLAKIVAEHVGRKVVFEIPDSVESAGYSTATKARLDNGKISLLDWKAKYDIEGGICRTIDIMSEIG